MTGKKKLNIVDIVIIISLILIVATVVYRIILVNTVDSSAKEQNISFTFTTSNVDIDYKDYLRKGDKLYLQESKMYCGEIAEIVPTYVKEYTINDDGTKEEHINPEQIKLTITVNVNARVNKSKIYLGDNVYLIPGQQLNLYTKIFSIDGKLNSFSVNNGN